ncbi:hypothetical protein GCM10023221_21180 [Luteimicrobium xylanilyticum]|uniref:Uncharacterized protein n=1 Tax=Luteimicrobium xylanilyticum TaxID=1133546 RepID=A0A5P9Q785_9MICO|nr:hypothetical protein [Luteimicrobium xylanilyticum]QFU96950.1 hypothetical protein KDY119_00442 [Luteimicrobium xylanilyticum]
MPKPRRKRAHPRPQRRRAPAHPAPLHDASPEDLELFQSLRRGLRADEPLDLLVLVSGMLAVSDARVVDMAAAPDVRATMRGDLVESLIGAAFAETTAALTALRTLLPDDDSDLVAAVDTELRTRRHPMPAWLSTLGQARVVGPVWKLTEVLGDGDDYVWAVELPTGEALTALVYVDHNLGGLVKDAFVAPTTLDEFVSAMRVNLDDRQTLAPADPAEVRAVVDDAIRLGLMTYPPVESDTWPVARPLVEWMLSLLPDGGHAPEAHEWTPEELESLEEEFFASSFGHGVDRPEARGMARLLFEFAASYTGGDPLRWSGVNVEILLMDLVPRKVMAPAEDLAVVPDLIRAIIPFAHARRGVSPQGTVTALESLDHFEPLYRDLVASDDRGEVFGALRDLIDPEGFMVDELATLVGGREALDVLDDEPLPDEPFVWDGVPDDVHDRVAEIVALCDGAADRLLDVEHRTAMRRFVARVAVADPAIFRRRASVERGSAAVAWAVCRANNSAGAYQGLTLGELVEAFGVTGSVSQRAEPMLRALGVDPSALPSWRGGHGLGSPDLLVSDRRRALLDERDMLAEGEDSTD